jgi:hypothetical protein
MHTTLLVAICLLGQGRGTASIEFRNRTKDQTVTVWIWKNTNRGWVRVDEAQVLGPKLTRRLPVSTGHYRLSFKSDFNATLVMDRTLRAGELDLLQIGEPAATGEGSRQMRVFAVRSNGGYNEAKPPPMTPPSS